MNNIAVAESCMIFPPLVTEVTVSVDLCECGEESEYGVHGMRDNEVYSKYYCNKCYYKDKSGRVKDE